MDFERRYRDLSARYVPSLFPSGFSTFSTPKGGGRLKYAHRSPPDAVVVASLTGSYLLAERTKARFGEMPCL